MREGTRMPSKMCEGYALVSCEEWQVLGAARCELYLAPHCGDLFTINSWWLL